MTANHTEQADTIRKALRANRATVAERRINDAVAALDSLVNQLTQAKQESLAWQRDLSEDIDVLAGKLVAAEQRADQAERANRYALALLRGKDEEEPDEENVERAISALSRFGDAT